MGPLQDVDADGSGDAGGGGEMIAPVIRTDRAWSLWKLYTKEYEFDAHQMFYFCQGVVAYDRQQEAAQMIEAEGVTIKDRFGQLKMNPAVEAENKYSKLCSHYFSKLGLDFDALNDKPGRPPQASQISLF
jgi:hypothetical protein